MLNLHNCRNGFNILSKSFVTMLKVVSFIIVLLSFSYSGFTQAFQIRDLGTLTDQFSYERSRIISIYGVDHYDIEGTPFLNESFIIGEVLLNDSVRFVNIPLRYNIYNDRMEFKNEREQILELDIAKDGFVFFVENQVFLMRDYIYDGFDSRGVLELIADGKIRLYKKYKIEFKPATAPRGFQEAKPNRLVRQRDKFLLSIDGQTPRDFRNRNELITALQSIDPGIEDYIKDKRLNINSEKDMKRIVERINN